MGIVPPTSGEAFFLRILLLHVSSATSFSQLRTVNGTEYITFQLAALAKGLLENEQEALIAFQTVIPLSTPSELRNLLVVMTVQGFPTLPIIENEAYFAAMYDDFLHHNNECLGNIAMAKNQCLIHLQRQFSEHGGDDLMESFGFPLPTNIDNNNEIERLKLKFSVIEQKELLHHYLSEKPNTDEQEFLMNKVKIALQQEQRLLVFIQGSAGTGKTTFAKKLTAMARSMGLIALGCAATGLAAQVYGDDEEFTTAHDLFGIPVIEDNEDIDHEAEITSKYTSSSPKLQMLLEARLFVWDEALTNHKHCLATAFKILNRFEGKVLILMGDWRQTPPVVVHGDQHEIINASMICSSYWSMFQIYNFTINQRLLALTGPDVDENFKNNQLDYLDMINTIGDGKTFSPTGTVLNMYDENIDEDGSYIVALPRLSTLHCMKDAIFYLFPDGFNSATMHFKAILCATNAQVDEWNTAIQELNPAQSHVLCSSDTVKDIDDIHGHLRSMLNESVLERFQKNGVPHHQLQLKVNDICILLRTLNRKEGLTNNTRVRILNISTYCIRVCTLDDSKRKYFNIPRIRFAVKLPYGRSIEMLRIQFPLRLAYSVTYNKSQGQEFNVVVCDTRVEPFTHGHLYVALSRIRIASNIRIFTNEKNADTSDDGLQLGPMVKNVVYQALKL